MSSVFQNIAKERILYEGKHFRIIKDAYPVSLNHLLIVSNERKENFFSLSLEEQLELPSMIIKAKETIEETDKPDGYNIGMNCGAVAGQTVFIFIVM